MNLREKVNAWIESLKGFDLLKGNRWEGMLATFVLSFIWGVCVGISFCVGYQFRNYLLCKQINWYDLYVQAIGCAAAFVLVNGILLAVKILF